MFCILANSATLMLPWTAPVVKSTTVTLFSAAKNSTEGRDEKHAADTDTDTDAEEEKIAVMKLIIKMKNVLLWKWCVDFFHQVWTGGMRQQAPSLKSLP